MSAPQSYEAMRRDELAREYLAPSYSEANNCEQHLIAYTVELESLLWTASGTDMRLVHMARMTGEPVKE